MRDISNRMVPSAAQFSFILILTYCSIILISISLKAWIYEDAFITFRTIIHFVDGFGLRWNIDERVQTYTHPLWMLLHIPFYIMTKNIFLVSLTLCIVCSMSACAITLLHLRKGIDFLLLGGSFVVPLLFSKTFGLFATSGFESPLIFLLFSIFCLYLFSARKETPWLGISLAISLSAMTRLDSLLLFLPLFCYLVYRERDALPYKNILLGFSPLILWELFSIIYYGSPFPNTKYAKLNTDLPVMEFYIKRGMEYFLDCFHLDLLTVFTILLGIFVTGIWFYKWYQNHKDKRAAKFALLGLGLTFYVLYTIRIGGDYLSLRLWVVPFFTFLVYINYSIFNVKKEMRNHLASGMAIAMILIFAFHYAISPGYYSKMKTYGVTTMHYNKEQSLKYPLGLIKENAITYDLWRKPAEQMNAEARKQNKPIFKSVACIGIQGFYADPNVILTDPSSLSDSLNARLPVRQNRRWRIGHFPRQLPKGYERARMNGDFSMMDPDLAIYYKKIRLITTGPLFSIKRLKTIVAFNLGLYDKYRKSYVEKNRAEKPKDSRRKRTD